MLNRHQNSPGTASGDREAMQGIVDTFRVLLEHWIEHNAAHGTEFQKWAERASDAGLEEVSRKIAVAADCLRESNSHLHDAVAHVKPDEKERGHVSK